MNLDRPARDLLDARVEAVADSPLRRAGRIVTAVAASAVAGLGDATSGPAVPAHLVVFRRDDGTVVLRVETNLLDQHLPAHVRAQLDTLTVAQFYERWGVSAG